MPLPLYPDTVSVVREALLAQPSITALVGTRIYARIPTAPVWPLIVVGTVDDTEAPDPILGESRIQLDVWGAGGTDSNTQQARLIARNLRDVSSERAVDGGLADDPERAEPVQDRHVEAAHLREVGVGVERVLVP